MHHISSGAFSHDFLALRQKEPHRHLRCLYQHRLHQIPLQEGLRQHLRKKLKQPAFVNTSTQGTSPTPSASTPTSPSPNTFAEGSSPTASANHNNLPQATLCLEGLRRHLRLLHQHRPRQTPLQEGLLANIFGEPQ
jgi:hypothetical protein